jgi:phytoene synthase
MAAIDTLQQKVFKKGSRTYYYSSLFFPKKIKKDVFSLYAFVRIADDFVDAIPSKVEAFESFQNKYLSNTSSDKIIQAVYKLEGRGVIQRAEMESFFKAMAADIPDRIIYKTYADLQTYMYGSAEVIGIFMSRIMGLSPAALSYARKLGEAMQYINFLRDIAEDITFGRQYIPQEILDEHGLPEVFDLEFPRDRNAFVHMMRVEITRYRAIQKEARKGFTYIPYRYLIPIKTASDMYAWTAQQIYKNPMIVFEKKVKPSKQRLIFTLLKNSLVLTFRYGGLFRKV